MNRVLVDTSVWVDHFRRRHSGLVSLLAQDRVLMHPMVLGELACGTPPARVQTLADLAHLQPAQQASLDEAIGLLEREGLYGQGCGIVDILLLASTRLTPGATLWSLDKRLGSLAERLGVTYQAMLQ